MGEDKFICVGCFEIILMVSRSSPIQTELESVSLSPAVAALFSWTFRALGYL